MCHFVSVTGPQKRYTGSSANTCKETERYGNFKYNMIGTVCLDNIGSHKLSVLFVDNVYLVYNGTFLPPI